MREGVRFTDVRHPIQVAAELPAEPAMPPSRPVEHQPHQIGSHDAEGFRTHTIPGDVCLGCSDPAAGRWVPISRCPRALAELDAEDPEGTLTVPESIAIPERFTSPDVTDFSTDARPVEKHGCKRGPIEYPLTAGWSVPLEVDAAGYEPPGVHLPESLGGSVDEQAEEIKDHLRDIGQGLLTVLAELGQIGESTQALLSARLYFVEFTETADGTDFASELAEVGTKVRHLQRILAAAEHRSTS